LFAYIIAKHYNISLKEVYSMNDNLFTQSLSWALAIQEEEARENARQRMEANTGQEAISMDYDFLQMEGDF